MVEFNIKKYSELFGDFWFQTPLYYFNFDHSLRFDLDKKDIFKEEILIFINNLFFDIFKQTKDLYIIGECHNKRKKYDLLSNYGMIDAKFLFSFKYNSKLPKLFKVKSENQLGIKSNHIACVYQINKEDFSVFNHLFCHVFKGGIVDYPHIVISNSEKDVFFQIYDTRGCDVVIRNKALIKQIYEKYSKWILEYNRKEIQNKLNIR